jgi:hypothetical protein
MARMPWRPISSGPAVVYRAKQLNVIGRFSSASSTPL